MDSVIFYRSFLEAISVLPDGSQLAAYKAIIGYGLDGTEPSKEDPMAYAIFLMAKPQIDANIKRKTDGMRGGRPKKTSGYENAKPVVTEKPKTEKPNVNVKVNENVKVKSKYGSLQNVLLTEEEYRKLVEKYGQDKANKAVEFLGSYIAEKAYKSNSHYLSIRRWVIDAVSKPGSRPNKFTEFSGRQNYDMTELEKMLEG